MRSPKQIGTAIVSKLFLRPLFWTLDQLLVYLDERNRMRNQDAHDLGQSDIPAEYLGVPEPGRRDLRVYIVDTHGPAPQARRELVTFLRVATGDAEAQPAEDESETNVIPFRPLTGSQRRTSRRRRVAVYPADMNMLIPFDPNAVS